MRTFLTLVFVLLAVPVLAQERECRGKQAFDLGDGAKGCLLDLGLTSIRTTTTRDDGASSKTRSNGAGRIDVALFGAYSSSKQVTSKRIRAICQTFLPSLKSATSGRSYHRIVVQVVWPNVANPGDFVPTSESEVAIQAAFTSASCRGVRYFG